jgi:hypothetical protein
MWAASARADERPADIALDAQINQCNDGIATACVDAARTYELAAGCVGQAVHALLRACKLGDKTSCATYLLSRYRKRLKELRMEVTERVTEGDINTPRRERSWNQVQEIETERRKDIEKFEALVEEVQHPGLYERDETTCRGQLVWFTPDQPDRVLIPHAMDMIRAHCDERCEWDKVARHQCELFSSRHATDAISDFDRRCFDVINEALRPCRARYIHDSNDAQKCVSKFANDNSIGKILLKP